MPSIMNQGTAKPPLMMESRRTSHGACQGSLRPSLLEMSIPEDILEYEEVKLNTSVWELKCARHTPWKSPLGHLKRG